MEIKFCPYCGTKLNEGDEICSHCGAEINFVDSGAIDSDNYEELKIIHEGVKLGKRTFVLAVISTLLSFFLPIFFLQVEVPEDGSLAPFLIIQLIIYMAIIANAFSAAYSIYNNHRCKKHAYNSIGWFKATTWISLFGLAFGIMFVLVLVVKSLVPSTNNPSSSGPIAALLQLLPLLF